MRYVAGADLRALLRREGALDARARDRDRRPGRRRARRRPPARPRAPRRQAEQRPARPADGREHCYLADFGLTQSTADRGPADGRFMGTVDYVAPEQIRGDAVDGRADQYGLACLLFECLTGIVPYRRRSDVGAHLRPPRGAGPARERAPRRPARRARRGARARAWPRTRASGSTAAARSSRRARCARARRTPRRGAPARRRRRGGARRARGGRGRVRRRARRREGRAAAGAVTGSLVARRPADERGRGPHAGGRPSRQARGDARRRLDGRLPRGRPLALGDPGRPGSSGSRPTASRATSPRSASKVYVAADGKASPASSRATTRSPACARTALDLLACAMASGEGVVWAAGCPSVQRLSTDGRHAAQARRDVPALSPTPASVENARAQFRELAVGAGSLWVLGDALRPADVAAGRAHRQLQADDRARRSRRARWPSRAAPSGSPTASRPVVPVDARDEPAGLRRSASAAARPASPRAPAPSGSRTRSTARCRASTRAARRVAATMTSAARRARSPCGDGGGLGDRACALTPRRCRRCWSPSRAAGCARRAGGGGERAAADRRHRGLRRRLPPARGRRARPARQLPLIAARRRAARRDAQRRPRRRRESPGGASSSCRGCTRVVRVHHAHRGGAGGSSSASTSTSSSPAAFGRRRDRAARRRRAAIPHVAFVAAAHGPREVTLRRPAPNLYRFAADHGQGVAGLADLRVPRRSAGDASRSCRGRLGRGLGRPRRVRRASSARSAAASTSQLAAARPVRPGGRRRRAGPARRRRRRRLRSSFFATRRLPRRARAARAATRAAIVVGPDARRRPDRCGAPPRALDGVVGSSFMPPTHGRAGLRAYLRAIARRFPQRAGATPRAPTLVLRLPRRPSRRCCARSSGPTATPDGCRAALARLRPTCSAGRCGSTPTARPSSRPTLVRIGRRGPGGSDADAGAQHPGGRPVDRRAARAGDVAAAIGPAPLPARAAAAAVGALISRRRPRSST